MRPISTHVWIQIAGTVAAGVLMVSGVLHVTRAASSADEDSEAVKMEQAKMHRVADSVSHLVLMGDLVLSGESTYLVQVVEGQADALYEQLLAMGSEGSGAFVGRLHADIEELSGLIVAGGNLDADGRDQKLNAMYAQFDELAEVAVKRIESCLSQLEPKVAALQAAARNLEARAYSMTIMAAGAFLAAVIGLWWYLTVVISRPIARLARAVTDASTTDRFVSTTGGTTEVCELSDSFSRLFEGLQAALAGRAAFLANTSHELRTPLNAIIGYAELLSDANVTGEEQAEGIASIASAGQHLLSLIEDVLDLSKIDAGHMTVEAIPSSPRTIISQVHSMLKGTAEAKGVELLVDVADDVPSSLLTDPVRLRQILVNVTGNAVKFTEHGSVRLSARWENGELHCAIVDTGIGFAVDRAEAIFEDFKQADTSSTRFYGGTGLGLAISRRLARLMGGDLWATSVLGEGSRFSLRIESAAALEGPPSLVSSEDQRALREDPTGASEESELPLSASVEDRPARVLLVDDVEINRRIGGRLLKRLGMEVSVAENGQHALEVNAAADELFDVILMDLQMPVMSGYEATTELRARGFQGGILALSAAVMPEQQKAAIAAGCDGFVGKPFQAQELGRAIAQAMANRNALQRAQDH